MCHIQGGKTLNDISSDKINNLCLSLRSDLLRRCLDEQIKGGQRKTFLPEPEHNIYTWKQTQETFGGGAKLTLALDPEGLFQP